LARRRRRQPRQACQQGRAMSTLARNLFGQAREPCFY
jgi:hypothetical protein